MDSNVKMNDPEAEKVPIGELEEVLKKFEPEAEFHKLRNTAVYHCFRHCLDMNVQEVAKRSPAKVSGTGISGKG